MDESPITSWAQSPIYIPSSHSTSPDPLLFPEPQTQEDPLIEWLGSPCSVTTALAIDANINAITLQGIATSLVGTIRVREQHHIDEKRYFKEKIAHLEARIEAHEENFQCCPKGYVKNTKYPDLTVGLGNRLHHPAKWIKMLNKGMLSVFTADDGPGSSPHLIKIYAQPCRATELVEPLLGWLECILTGPTPYFLMLVEASDELDNWGIKADLLCYRDLENSL
jgi:hypothetical protein